jgi:hypothetical protein
VVPPPPPPDFTISVAPISGTTLAGGSASYTVTVTGQPGFSGPVGLAASSMPAGAGASFSPLSITGSGTSAMTITTAAGSAAGNYSFGVTGTSSSLAHSATGSIGVQDFGLTVSPTGVALSSGSGSATYQVTATRLNGYNGDIHMAQSITWNIGGFYCTSFQSFPDILSGTNTTIMTLRLTNCPVGGPYVFTMQGNAGAIQRYSTGSLTVTGGGGSGDFWISVSQISQTVTAGGPPATYGLAVGPLGNFWGTVNFTVSGVPSGANASTIASINGAGSSTVTVNVPAGTAAGSFPLTITATSTSPSLSHTITPMLIVQTAQGSLPANLLFPPSPQEGSNLTGSTSFGWDSGVGVSQYSLVLESAPGLADCSPKYTGTDHSAILTPYPSCCLPGGIHPMYATLGSYTSNASQSQSYRYCGIRGWVTGVSVSPAAGTGSSQTFTATYSDGRGYFDISQAKLLIQASATSDSANQCIMWYVQGQNSLYLLADDGVTNLGPIAAGGYDTLANSQCAVTGGYNVIQSGNTLSVDFSVIFTTSFVGIKQLFLNGLDGSGNSGANVNVGSWTVPTAISGGATSTPATPADPVSPAPTPTLPAAVTSLTAQNCSDITGVWSDPNIVDPNGPNASWSLRQNSNSVLGSLTATYTGDGTCGPVNLTWNTVTGNLTGPATVHLDATAPSQAYVTCNGAQRPVAAEISVDVAVACTTALPSNYNSGPTLPAPLVGYPVPLAVQAPVSSWTRANPAGIILKFDLGAGNAVVTLTTPGKSGTLSVVLNQGSPSAYTVKQVTATIDNPFYTIPFDRTQIPAQVDYASATATLDDLSVTVPVSFHTLGYTRFSRYNVPAEGQCGGGQAQAYILSGNLANCSSSSFAPAFLNSEFIDQADWNGTGQSILYGLMKL